MVHMMALVFFECCIMTQFLGQRLNVLAGRTVDLASRFDLWVDGLVQTAELQLLLVGGIEQLLGAGGGGIEAVVAIVVGLRRRRV